MDLTASGGSLVYKSGSIGTGENCCCNNQICGSSCSGNGLPQSLVFSITSCSIVASDLTFDPVDDWTIDLDPGCSFYSANFFSNNPGVFVCSPAVCFTGCIHKLIIFLSLSGSFYGIRVIIADINPNTSTEIGGDFYDTTQRSVTVCDRSFPFSGSLTLGCGGSIDYTVDEA